MLVEISVPSSGFIPAAVSRGAAAAPWELYTPKQRWGYLTVLFLVIASNYFDYYIVSIVLDPIKQEFRLSDTALGMLGGFSFALVYALAALPLARWADRGNRRTITALAVAGWSMMTVACGLAQSFTQLLVSRMGVAVTEPGAAPPAQSLVVDYFPPERRATAVALLSQGGSAVGYWIAIGLGGYVAAKYGWRNAFFAAGVPGVILALIVRLTLAEPRSKMGFPGSMRVVESARHGLLKLCAKRSYLYTLLGLTLFTIFGYGTSVFLPSFMIRTLQASLQQVSATWSFVAAAAMLIGALVGGWLADRLGRRDVRWYAWLPAIASALGIPLYWATLSAKSLWGFIAMDFPAELILTIVSSVSFAAIHAVCGTGRRALAVAVVYFSIMLIGCGLGPLLAGALSDALQKTFGAASLRYSLLAMILFLVPAAVAFYAAGRTMVDDLELYDRRGPEA